MGDGVKGCGLPGRLKGRGWRANSLENGSTGDSGRRPGHSGLWVEEDLSVWGLGYWFRGSKIVGGLWGQGTRNRG